MDTDVFIRQAHSLMESACLEMNLINENSLQERQVLILFEAGYQSRKGNFACRADHQAVLYAAFCGKAKQISAKFVAALHQKPSGKQLGQCPGIGRWAELSQGSALPWEAASTCSFHGVLVGYWSCCLF